MEPLIRQYRRSDEASVVELSLRAWEPNFASTREELGDPVFGFLYLPDWRTAQAGAVRRVLHDESMHVWVADVGGQTAGFVAATADRDSAAGSIEMLAVDPRHQRQGLGLRLTGAATDWMRNEGLKLAVVEAGGDAGHAPARRTYQSAGYVQMPIARYFKLLDPPAPSEPVPPSTAGASNDQTNPDTRAPE